MKEGVYSKRTFILVLSFDTHTLSATLHIHSSHTEGTPRGRSLNVERATGMEEVQVGSNAEINSSIGFGDALVLVDV